MFVGPLLLYWGSQKIELCLPSALGNSLIVVMSIFCFAPGFFFCEDSFICPLARKVVEQHTFRFVCLLRDAARRCRRWHRSRSV